VSEHCHQAFQKKLGDGKLQRISAVQQLGNDVLFKKIYELELRVVLATVIGFDKELADQDVARNLVAPRLRLEEVRFQQILSPINTRRISFIENSSHAVIAPTASSRAARALQLAERVKRVRTRLQQVQEQPNPDAHGVGLVLALHCVAVRLDRHQVPLPLHFFPWELAQRISDFSENVRAHVQAARHQRD